MYRVRYHSRFQASAEGLQMYPPHIKGTTVYTLLCFAHGNYSECTNVADTTWSAYTNYSVISHG